MHKVIRKVGNWEFIKDEFMGVTNFVNKDIKYQSLANTGYEAIEEMGLINKMSDAEFIEYAEDNKSESELINISI